jgi:alpha-tubulin suppressor-like RCC1 family protein
MIRFLPLLATTSTAVAIVACGSRTGLLVDLAAGDGASDSDARLDSTPPPSSTPGAQLAVGDVSSCAIRDGRVWCWGDNSFGQLGQGASSAPRPAASEVPGLSGVLEIVATLSADLGDPARDERSSHFCGRLSDGTVWCWGPNVGGNPVPGGTTSDFYQPTRIEGVAGAAQIAGGQFHTCVLLTDGSVRCWGDNENGQQGNGTVGGHNDSPTAVKDLHTATQIAASQSGTCAILQDSTVVCWGAVSVVVDVAVVPVSAPTPVPQLLNVGQISGADYLCARSDDGGVVCLDKGETNIDVVQGLAGATDVSGKDTHACAVLADGSVSCWGKNFDGVLGIGLTAPMGVVLPPQTVPNLAEVSEVRVSYYNTCAMTRGGAVWCWGDNGEGECGTSTPSQLLSPRLVEGFP